jgi:hypothetical protein
MIERMNLEYFNLTLEGEIGNEIDARPPGDFYGQRHPIFAMRANKGFWAWEVFHFLRLFWRYFDSWQRLFIHHISPDA